MADTNTDLVTLTVPRNQMRLIEAWGVHETERIRDRYIKKLLTHAEYDESLAANDELLTVVRTARGGI